MTNSALGAMYLDTRCQAIRIPAEDKSFITIVGLGTKSSCLPIFLPNQRFKKVWDFFVITFVMYNAIGLPLLLGFADQLLQPPAWTAIDYCVDLFFLFDIGINFRTGSNL